MDNDHLGMNKRIQQLEYNQHMMASCVADLACMVDPRPSTLDTEGQDWFQRRLEMVVMTMNDIRGIPNIQQNPTSINTNEVSPLGEQNVSRLL